MPVDILAQPCIRGKVHFETDQSDRGLPHDWLVSTNVIGQFEIPYCVFGHPTYSGPI